VSRARASERTLIEGAREGALLCTPALERALSSGMCSCTRTATASVPAFRAAACVQRSKNDRKAWSNPENRAQEVNMKAG
jgi:hypothetical protein